MKNRLSYIVLLTLLSVAVTAHSKTILNEGFDYPTGGTLDGTNKWSVSNGRKLNITEGTLTYPKLMTSGNKASIDSDTNADPGVYKITFEPIELDAAGKAVYFSFLVDIRNTGGMDAALQIDVGSASVVSTEERKGFYTRLNAKGSALNLHDGSHLIVGKFMRDSLDVQFGQLFLWVDPPEMNIGTKEPTGDPAAKTKNTPLSKDEWTIYSLEITLNGQNEAGKGMDSCADMDIDEIRVGTTWADVTPVPQKQERKILGLGVLLLLLASSPPKEY